ncbi:MAG: hypothetical protein HDT39_02620 [Lachnospiraceae bacterium]|nr:hypothetical protein [Lachnospiraceae bacterium]
MVADYIEILFEHISRLEIIQIVSELKYNIDDIKSSYYYLSSKEGNEHLSLSKMINLINNQYNITIMFDSIIMFELKLNNVLVMISSECKDYDLTFNFEKELFDNDIIKENIVKVICNFSAKLKDRLIYIGHEPVEDEDMRNLRICNGKITCLNREEGYWNAF